MSIAVPTVLAATSGFDRGVFLRGLVSGEGLGLLLLALWVAGLADVWATDTRVVRTGSKKVWQALVAIPGVGLLAWIVMGRPRRRRGPARGTDRSRGGPVRSGAGHLSVVPPLNQKEELNAQLARSEELNRQLEAWEREQRRRGDDPATAAKSPPPAGATDGDALPPDRWRAMSASAPSAADDTSTAAALEGPEAPAPDAQAPDSVSPAASLSGTATSEPDVAEPLTPDSAAAPTGPPSDPKHGDLTAWDADLARWEQELKQQDAED